MLGTFTEADDAVQEAWWASPSDGKSRTAELRHDAQIEEQLRMSHGSAFLTMVEGPTSTMPAST